MPQPRVVTSAGSLAGDYAAVDWAATPLGPAPAWSPALRGAVDLMLATRFPVTLFWGPEFTMVYNEAYVSLIGDKHPAALGAPAREVFPEAWAHIGPMMERVRAGGTPSWVQDDRVPLQRNGRLEECYFTFSYSPVFGPGDVVEGVMDIAIETTRDVVGRRRLALLRRLLDGLSACDRPEEVVAHAATLATSGPEDLPVVELRLGDAPAGARDGRLPAEPSAPVPETGVLVQEAGGARFGWLRLPGHPSALLCARLSDGSPADEPYREFLGLVAAALAQTLTRLEVRAAERRMSETLQKSMLTRPLQPDHLQVAVRYRPAAHEAQVGGDWYDAFMVPDGALTLVIGDVAGHDRHAAAAMGQVRNLLRGVAYTLTQPPARILAALDDAMLGLAVDVFATAILARVEQPASDEALGLRTLRWSNAGHPPPVLIGPDGGTRLLAAPTDPLLGIGDVRRADHDVALEPGGTVVFYTDGLIERRGVPLPESLRWLTTTLQGGQALSAEELCDHLIGQVEGDAEDDVALLVLRAHPEDRPRPAEAGPETLPEDLRTRTD
jgi:serine phosphatase RsbU (regulator of sigma subunit)